MYILQCAYCECPLCSVCCPGKAQPSDEYSQCGDKADNGCSSGECVIDHKVGGGHLWATRPKLRICAQKKYWKNYIFFDVASAIALNGSKAPSFNKLNFFVFLLKVSFEKIWGYRRPCKIQCTFYCHSIDKIIAPLFVYVGPPTLVSKWLQRTQLSDGVGC